MIKIISFTKVHRMISQVFLYSTLQIQFMKPENNTIQRCFPTIYQTNLSERNKL